MTEQMRAAALAFDAMAPRFDERFGSWLSVAAQRRAVRSALVKGFPPGGKILEIGGGTGEDASFLARHGYKVVLTDPSSAMVSEAKAKLFKLGSRAEVASAEELEEFAGLDDGLSQFDGAFSNFAPLNCVIDLEPVARGLAGMLKPGAPALLVLFGTFCPGEMLTELLRLKFSQVLRRRQRGPIRARLGQRKFDIVYHRRSELKNAFAPWFCLEGTLGIGVAVPPSGAEPWISRFPRFVAGLEGLDRVLSGPLAMLGDHVLYKFRRNSTPVPPTFE
jgi:ubiquinone/menaquinone biosynthesis C-methylase UbiE